MKNFFRKRKIKKLKKFKEATRENINEGIQKRAIWNFPDVVRFDPGIHGYFSWRHVILSDGYEILEMYTTLAEIADEIIKWYCEKHKINQVEVY